MTMFSRYLRNCPGTRVRASSTHFSNSWREMREELMEKLSAISSQLSAVSPWPEEAIEVGGRRGGDGGQVRALDLGKLLRGLDDEGRLGGLAAVRNRCEKRSVGLDEHRVERQARRRLTDVVGR